MKYSLRSLLVVVTLVCVVLAGMMARVEYLKGMAAHHEREAQRFREEMISKIKRQAEQDRRSGVSGISMSGAEEADASIYHELMAKEFRQAVHRPWTVVRAPKGYEAP